MEVDPTFLQETYAMLTISIAVNLYFILRKPFESFFDDGSGGRKNKKELYPR